MKVFTKVRKINRNISDRGMEGRTAVVMDIDAMCDTGSYLPRAVKGTMTLTIEPFAVRVGDEYEVKITEKSYAVAAWELGEKEKMETEES